jgi:predicted secreted protein
MNLISGFAVYFILWWLCFFAVLPFGNDSPHELGEQLEPGEAPSAPKNPHLLRKAGLATVVAAVVFAAAYGIVSSGVITFDDIPYIRDLKPYS